MAKDPKATESVAAPKSNKRLIIIVALVVLVLALGGGAAFLLMGGKSKKHGDKEQQTVADDAQGKPTPMVTVGDKFTVNLQSDDGSTHFLQVPKIELEMASDASAKKVDERKDKISDRINSTLRSKSMKEMMEPGSDLKLKEELKTVINSTLGVSPEDVAKNGVIEVIFPASFIVQ
ncbi:flagellar basal body-associated protein FliL [mine drainage metagenome]|uniref:Flagellar basal body-associated protein FliL n=1 Tax=mine drainage metagenome TaxID=410659 RepID=A0A1J5QDU5_9ZZZZ